MIGTEWDIERVASVTDGDTLRVVRSRIEHMGDHDFRITDVKSVPIRLVWVDTPEDEDHPGWENARSDLMRWIADHSVHVNGGGMRVIVYDGGAGWDRLLGDLIDAEGASASQWLMVERGWPPYRRGK